MNWLELQKMNWLELQKMNWLKIATRMSRDLINDVTIDINFFACP